MTSLAPLFLLDRSIPLSLQSQLRQKIVSAISIGALSPGHKMPSSRRLAAELGIGRNTVSLVYEQLIAEGFLAPRPRSGTYVADTPTAGAAKLEQVAGPTETDLSAQVPVARSADDAFEAPADWQRYRYPFLDGQFDRSLFPVAEWREASRLALSVKDVEHWSSEFGDHDDEMLQEEIRTKILPRRGIRAGTDELLVTFGATQALHLICELFVRKGTRVAVEEPGHPELRMLLKHRQAQLVHQPVDDQGLEVDGRLDTADLIYVSPSHQRPTAVTMTMARRQALLAKATAEGFLIVEDDYEREIGFGETPLPSLKSLETTPRVIHVSSLSKILAPGLRLGFMVGPADVIAQARRLRNLTTRQPPLSMQRIAAYFLSMGHYDATMWRLGRIFDDRVTALRDALNHYRPQSLAIAPVKGGTSLWVRGPEGLDAQALADNLRKVGVLVEPAGRYFAEAGQSNTIFRMGVTSIPRERIREGVAVLSAAIHDMSVVSTPVPTQIEYLDDAALRQIFSGARLVNQTVYGDPCTIELRSDGEMRGWAGQDDEDTDTGTWWVENGRWHRRWNSWAYGEAMGFFTELTGDEVRWYNADGTLVDRATLILT